ncbi:MAG: copper chaperone CopZ [Alicyclobacillaceae bacterium]|nr:copper chaperone CopZ [Alicyclobacillaceae bacterium]
MTTTVLQVKGMSCDHCVHAVESALKALDGVEKVRVDLGKGEVEVSFDSSRVGREQFRKAVEDAGYELVGA